MTVKMIDIGHHLTQREPDGEIYCTRCGLYSPSEEEQPCVPVRYDRSEFVEKAA
jgi:hypothetical protein